MREQILLSCSECKIRWYSTTKNKKADSGKLELKKFCKSCHRRTSHKEVR